MTTAELTSLKTDFASNLLLLEKQNRDLYLHAAAMKDEQLTLYTQPSISVQSLLAGQVQTRSMNLLDLATEYLAKGHIVLQQPTRMWTDTNPLVWFLTQNGPTVLAAAFNSSTNAIVSKTSTKFQTIATIELFVSSDKSFSLGYSYSFLVHRWPTSRLRWSYSSVSQSSGPSRGRSSALSERFCRCSWTYLQSSFGHCACSQRSD